MPLHGARGTGCAGPLVAPLERGARGVRAFPQGSWRITSRTVKRTSRSSDALFTVVP